MKRLIRLFLINCGAFYLASYLISGISFGGGIRTLALIGLVLTVMNVVLKPILKVFMLPFNIVTLGLFSWFLNVVILFLLTKIVGQIKISEFDFAGFSCGGFVIPALYLGIFETLIIGAVVINAVSLFLNWLAEK